MFKLARLIVSDLRAKADQAALIERFGGPDTARNVGAPGATPAPI